MPVIIAPQFTLRSYRWTAWKAVLSAKNGVYQCDEETDIYTVYFYDGPEAHSCTIWKGDVPDGVVQSGYAQSQNDTDRSDFETNYKSNVNRSIVARTDEGKEITSIWPTEGSKSTIISPNWCDKTTWIAQSVLVSGETLADSGDHATYTFAHQYVIDTYHGKISGEDYLRDANNASYRVAITVNGTAKTEQDPHLGSGGDFTIDYTNGRVAFLAALQPTDVVLATYHYAASSMFAIKPTPGKKLKVRRVETQFSSDIALTDSVTFNAYGLVDVFAPQLMPGVPSGTLIPLGNPVKYKTMQDYINDSNGAYPLIPACGGGGWRGLSKDIVTFAWDYAAMTMLSSLAKMEIRISLEHDIPFAGTFATATFYCLSEDE